MNISSTAFQALRIFRFRAYSHGPTVGSVYSEYKELDQSLRKLRPDLFTTIEQVEEAQKTGKITGTMAEQFIEDVKAEQEAKSTRTTFLYRLRPPLTKIESAEYWKKIFWYVGLPLTFIIGVNTYIEEKKHMDHLEEHPHVPPEYPHLRYRAKKLPWGDGEHTWFHNPKVNGP